MALPPSKAKTETLHLLTFYVMIPYSLSIPACHKYRSKCRRFLVFGRAGFNVADCNVEVFVNLLFENFLLKTNFDEWVRELARLTLRHTLFSVLHNGRFYGI